MKLLKTLSAAAMAMTCAASAWAVDVVPGTDYVLRIKETTLCLSINPNASENVKLQEEGAEGMIQSFSFETQGTNYNIKSGNYTIYRDSWNVKYTLSSLDMTADNQLFVLEADGDYYKIKNLGSGKYIGRDSETAGSSVYSDKDGDKTCYFKLEAVTADVYVKRINDKVKEAEELLASTTEGTAIGQYPTEARTALQNAINAAKAALTGDIAALKAADVELSNAVEVYKKTAMTYSMKEGTYKFAYKGIDGSYLASGWHANSWESSNNQPTTLILNAGQSGYNYEFVLRLTDKGYTPNTYTIQNPSGNYYYNAGGAFLFSEDKTAAELGDNALYTLVEDNGAIAIQSVATGKYVGVSGPWTWIHVGDDYATIDNNSLFVPEFVADLPAYELLQKELKSDIADAQKMLDETEEGTLGGQYPAEARTALAAAITAAGTMLDSTDEAELNKAIADLAAAVETYKKAEIPAENPAKKALETAIADAEKLLADTEEGSAAGQYPAEARTALAAAITAAGTMLDSTDEAELNKAIADLAAAVDTYKKAEIPAENPAKKALETAIADAEKLLADTEEGSAAGQYTAEARANLSNAISAAQSALVLDDEDALAEAKSDLETAVKYYMLAVNPENFKEGAYQFAYKGIEGSYLASGWQANSWEASNIQPTALILAPNENGYNYVFTVTRTAAASDANGYTIKNAEGNYFYNDNGQLLFSTEKDAAQLGVSAVFVFETNGTNVAIKSVDTGKYVGVEGPWNWIHVRTDYAKVDDNSLFTPSEYSSVGSLEGSTIVIRANGNVITVENADSATVYTLTGEMVATGNGNAAFELAPGVYVVRATEGNIAKTAKLIVR